MEAARLKNKLTIGRLARLAGVHVETIRYYQRLGLLRAPPRPPGRVREYGERDVGQLKFILRAKECGFTLSDIARLNLHFGQCDCVAMRALTEERLKKVEERLRILRKSRRILKNMLDGCNRNCQSCPLGTLAGHDTAKN